MDLYESRKDKNIMYTLIRKNIVDNFLYKISIKRRLIFYFILSVLLPVTLISTTIYVKSTNIITKRIDSSIQKNMNTTEAIIQQKVDSAKDISTLIILNLNSKIINILNQPQPNNIASLIEEMSALDDIIKNYSLQSIADLTKVSIYPKIYILDRPDYNQLKFSETVFDYGLIEDEPWVRDFPEGTFSFIGINHMKATNGSLDTLRFARKVLNLRPATTSFAGILTVDIETKYFNDILESFKSSSGSSVFVVDSKNMIILSNNPTLIGKSADEIKNINIANIEEGYHSYTSKIEGENMLVSVKGIRSLKWNIVALSPLAELNEELISFQNIVYIVLLICLGVSLLTALFLASNIAKPIQKLVRSMANVKAGNFEINLVYKRNDEFAFLISEYKRMIREIKELIEKLYVSERDKHNAELKTKDAELKTLQAQINPHFLYNTLDSVNWLAIKNNVPDISTMVKSLSNFFRYSLNKGDNVILWENEIKQVESYLQIQQIRFKDKLEYMLDIDSEILPNYTVKLILQPIVENAIIHGVEKTMGEGQIIIRGRLSDEVIRIEISDNGVGADIERLNKLLEDESSHSTSFGLRNVNLRIKQFFGKEYGLRFIENEECGITVVVIVPVRKEMEDSNA